MTPYYSDYGLFIGYFDDDRSLREPNRVPSVRDRFTSCYQAAIPATSQFASLLPCYATAFGHYDELAFALIDDLGYFAELTSWLPEIESYTLSICPTIASLSGTASLSHLCDPRELLFPLSEDAVSSHEPLIAVVHVRLNAMFSMRYGILAHAAAAELIASKVNSLLLACASDVSWLNMPADVHKDDYASARFALVEPLSSDDFTLFLRCSNYSVVAAVVACLRNLTIGDIGDDSVGSRFRGRLADLAVGSTPLSNSRPDISLLHIPITEAMDRLPSNAIHSVPRSTPLFSATYTTLAADETIDNLHKLADRVAGRVSVYGVADTTPGYDDSIMRSLTSLAPIEELTPAPSGAHFRYVHPGHHDVAYIYGPKSFSPLSVPMLTGDIFRALSAMHGSTEAQSAFEGADTLCDRVREGALDISTHLALPLHGRAVDNSISSQSLANWFGTSRDSDTCVANDAATTNTVLRELAHSIQRELGLHDTREHYHRLSAQLGLSESACAVALRTMNDFLSSMSDPLYFDDVLDLHDAVASFNAFTDSQARSARLSGSCKPTVDQRSATPHSHISAGEPLDHFVSWPTDVLAARAFAVEYIAALSTSLHWRIGRAAPRHDGYFARDDVRASLGDLFFSGDAIAKCCAGAVRVCLFGKDKAHAQSARKSVGVVMAAQLNRTASATITSDPSLPVHLLVINSDISRLFDVDHDAGVVHEFGHLLYASLYPHTGAIFELFAVTKGVRFSPPTGRELAQQDTWLSEVFADLFLRYFVFGQDHVSFMRYAARSCIRMLEEHRPGGSLDLASALVTTATLMARSEYACRLWSKAHNESAPDDLLEPWRDELCPALSRFIAFESGWGDIRALSGAVLSAHTRSIALMDDFVLAPVHSLYGELFSHSNVSRDWADQCLEDVSSAHKSGVPYPLQTSPCTNWDESQVVFASLRARLGSDAAPLFRRSDETSSQSSADRGSAAFREAACHYKTLVDIAIRQRARRLLDLLPAGVTGGSACP